MSNLTNTFNSCNSIGKTEHNELLRAPLQPKNQTNGNDIGTSLIRLVEIVLEPRCLVSIRINETMSRQSNVSTT
jgi:hypothetical protein